MSGPGWLQSAITLGGGTLSSSLYLGVLGGFGLLWLQPGMMLLGIVMLAAIGHVTLVSGQRPFLAMRHVNPMLAWGWAIASLVASMVWCMPQYALSVGVLQQNLLPTVFGRAGYFSDFQSKVILAGLIFVGSTLVTWSFGAKGVGAKIYEALLKLMVGVIVLCFLGVVWKLTQVEGGLDWGAIWNGMWPKFSSLTSPALTYEPLLQPLDPAARSFWSAELVSLQRDVIIAGAATAVGINMTFLLPYSLLNRGWNREFSGLLRFDLLTGMFLPFVLVTSCIVIAAASRFHTQPVAGLVEGAADVPARIVADYEALLARRLDVAQEQWQGLGAPERKARIAQLSLAERHLAATLAKRDAYDLAASLEPLTGRLFANLLFGVGVLGMALSTITLLMHISGFVVCEMLGRPSGGWLHRLASLLAASGTLGPFLGRAQVYVAMPTSVFCMMFLPIAYWAFFFMMRNPSIMGEARLRGGTATLVNALMLLACLVATAASLWSLWSRFQGLGILLFAALAGVTIWVGVRRRATVHLRAGQP